MAKVPWDAGALSVGYGGLHVKMRSSLIYSKCLSHRMHFLNALIFFTSLLLTPEGQHRHLWSMDIDQ